MSLLSSIGRFITTNVVQPAANAIGSVINAVAGKKVYTSQTAEQTFGNTAGKIYETVLGGAASAVAVAAAPTVAKAAVTAAKAAPIKAAAVAAAAVVAGSALLKSPTLQEKAANTDVLGSLSNFGGNVGELIETPSLEKAKEIFTENPVIAGGITAAAALTVGKGLAGAVATIMNTQAEKANTEAMLGSSSANSGTAAPQTSGAIGALPTNQPLNLDTLTTDNSMPQNRPTENVTIGAKKRKRRARIKEKPSVRQNVRVSVINSATGQKISNKRYLNEVIYA